MAGNWLRFESNECIATLSLANSSSLYNTKSKQESYVVLVLLLIFNKKEIIKWQRGNLYKTHF
ncbi:protein of unknown function [Shewanella benthica]|uniref:Uncharacterized protein n=1 Tax=Shewanella benthica TaxID=43661 RepID=A0A330LYW3_9GAMM|nr:protein of unknown function [Shewanella benthica]